MQKPNLNRAWETYIEIPSLTQLFEIFSRSPTSDNAARISKCVFDVVRFKIYPMISELRNNGVIKWYCFLIHRSRRKDDPKLYFHIRFEPKEGIDDEKSVNDLLPKYCEKDQTKQCKDVEDVDNISGIDKLLLRSEEIEEAWRIIGEQSEWFMNMLMVHKENVEITPRQIGQFLHFYFNIAQLLFVCPYCRNVFHSAGTITFT